MVKPFQDWNTHFLGNNSLSRFFITQLKNVKVYFLYDQITQENFFEAKLGFLWKVFFNFWDCSFWTYIRVTLLSCCNLKTLLPKIITFRKTCTCARKKSQKVSWTTFHQCELFYYQIFWRIRVQCKRKGNKFPFSHTVCSFVKILIINNFTWIIST